MAVKWTSELAVGIENVDHQHKKLFEIVNQLADACNERRGKEEVGNVLNFLQNYVKEHFRDEEFHMLQNKYPEYKTHKQIHDEFTNNITDLITKFNNDGVNLSILISTNKMVFDWLRKHIMEKDKAFGKYMASK